MTGQFGQYIQDLERNMSNKNIVRLKEEKRELLSLIKKCNNYKKQIVSYEKQLRTSYNKKLITRYEYEEKLKSVLKGRTEKQWSQYYEKVILVYSRRIIEINKEIKQSEQNKFVPIITIALFLALLGLSYYLLQPQITGFTVQNGNGNNSIFTIPIVNINNETLNNISNESAPVFTIPIINVTENITHKTDLKNLLEWNYKYLDKDKIKDSDVEFNGKDYEIIEGSEDISIVNNEIEIETTVKIEENSTGVIVSKFDYPNVRHIEVAVDVTGSIKFDITYVNFSTILETNKTYNDGKYHKITALMNKTIAQIYVDDILEVEENITSTIDINSNSPISIGANSGYINYMHQTISNFNGRIREVKIYY